MSKNPSPVKKGRKYKKLPALPAGSSHKDRFQMRVKSFVRSTLKYHGLDYKKASEITGIPERRFSDWFLANPQNRRSITLTDLLLFVEKIEHCAWLGPIDLHGRKCNWVSLFEPGYLFTAYERENGLDKLDLGQL